MTEFFRLSGGGNDFLALLEPEREPSSEQIRAWCARGLSLGADGLFLLRRTPGGVRMDHFNADGRPAELCINGTRCAALLAMTLEWSGSELVVETGAGPVPARRVGEHGIALTLPTPAAPDELVLEVDGDELPGWRVDSGVPHFVTIWPRPLGQAPVAELGPRLRTHPALGEAGANVDFVRFPGTDRLEIRTFERGVEAETLACGTGVLAACAVGLTDGRLQTPIQALTAGGFALTVDSAGEERLTLAGDARLLASGRLWPEAGELPEPPLWS
ncbi:MAG: diaminopimelate epimerase [Thermoanaerobaculia bacterium]